MGSIGGARSKINKLEEEVWKARVPCEKCSSGFSFHLYNLGTTLNDFSGWLRLYYHFKKSPHPISGPWITAWEWLLCWKKEVYYLKERAPHYLHFSLCFQIACHCPFNTLKLPNPSFPKNVSGRNHSYTKMWIPTRSPGIPLHTNGGAALQGEDSQGSPSQLQISASLIKEKHKNGLKWLRQDFFLNVAAGYRNTSTKNLNKSDVIISEFNFF